MTESEQRQAVITEAKRWLRTPFVHMASVFQVGCDCVTFPVAVYKAVGVIDDSFRLPSFYPPDWHLHRNDHRYIDGVRSLMTEVDTPQPGDFAMFHYGRDWAHGAIVVAWPSIIHSSRVAQQVSWADASRDVELLNRRYRPLFFDPWRHR